jgi:NAD(P)-dependent dehydrogenase (short-subunit alcohol dehydrogenase family)
MSKHQKVAIVTGASQGMGAGIVKAYRDNGFVVIANSRNIKQSSDDGIVAVPGAIGDRAVAEKLAATAIEKFGRIDTLVNNAGIFIGKPFPEYTLEDYRNVFETNIDGFFHITQMAIPHMLKQGSGHVVQVTTTLVRQAMAVNPSGLATLTKGGLEAVTRGLAIEYAKRGIRFNAVAPGIIKTPMHSADKHEFLGTLHPMGRMGEIQDIVEAVLYLERAKFVTGEILNVDGGQHAGH